MKKASQFIVNHRKLMALMFLVLMVFSVFSMNWVNVEEDITVYLPDTAEAKKGLDVMNRELKTYASGTVLVRGIDKDDAEALGEEIEGLDGVLQVGFDADSTQYYKDDYAKYSITFSGTASDEKAKEGLNNLNTVLEEYDADLVSESFSNYSDILETQMSSVLVFVAIIVVIVLLLTSTTYAEVLVFLGTFIAAALINMGTNFFMGTISFVSNSVAVVLQLALSVDYAIILCNRYKEEHETKDIKEAVQSALEYSIPAISASSLTTIAGLAAMMFMQFQLGMDMGIALIKAIVISLLSVFLFMPFLLCLFGKLMDKTKHKNFIPKVDFLGKFAYATRNFIPLFFVILVVFAYMGFNKVSYDYDGKLTNVFNESSESKTEREIEEIFGSDNVVALIVPGHDYEKKAKIVKELELEPGVTGVTSIVNIEAVDGYCLGDMIDYKEFMEIADMDEQTSKALFAYYAAGNGDSSKLDDIETYKAPLVDLFMCAYDLTESGDVELSASEKTMIEDLYAQLSQATDQLEGENYSCIAINNSYDTQGRSTYDFLDSILVLAEKEYGSDVYITGDQVSCQGFASTFSSDTQIVSILSIILVMLILLLTFKSVAMPVLLIIVIQGSIWLNFAVAAWTGSYVFFMCYLIVSSIQMGANIDYAIVISTRYTEMRNNGDSSKEAIIKTLNLAFPTVLTSGTMMVFSGALIALRISESVIAGMGQYVATGTVITLILVNFVLPQILVFGDRIIQATTMNLRVPKFVYQLISAAMVLSLVLGSGVDVYAISSINNIKNQEISEDEEIKNQVVALKEIADNMTSDIDSVKYEFAETYVTDDIGSEQLAEGQKEYDEGAAELSAAKSEYASGASQYEAALQQYNEGVAQVAAAEAQLADGQAQYDAGLAQYEAGKATFAEKQAEYNAGLAEYEAGQAEYDEAQAQLSAVEPIYNAVIPLYNEYQSVQQQYDAAIASRDLITATSLQLQVTAAKTAFEASLGGYSISSLISEYESGQAQLAAAAVQLEDAKVQLADAETQLAAGQAELNAAEAQLNAAKAQLDDGYAQLAAGKAELAEGEAQLAAAKKELESGASQISAGQSELDSAKDELDEGKEVLAQNKKSLLETMSTLDSYDDDLEKLKAGKSALLEIAGVAEILPANAEYSGTFLAAEKYFDERIDQINTTATIAYVCAGAILAAIAIYAIGLILKFRRKTKLSKWFLVVATGVMAVSAIVWNLNCSTFGYYLFIAALIIIGVWAIYYLIGLLKNKDKDDLTIEIIDYNKEDTKDSKEDGDLDKYGDQVYGQ